MNYELIVLLLALGAVVGTMSGLLGIGGGLIVVPALAFLLPKFDISGDLVMQIALATSLASIIITSGSSALNHLKLGNVDLFVIKWLMPGVVIGGFAGSNIAEWIPFQYLPRVFALIVLALAVQMFLSLKYQSTRQLPSPFKTTCYGAGIGMISSLAGIGGGSMSVPFLSKHGVEMRKAVGSSSVCGCVIAMSGMLGFIMHGASVEELPPYSIGYVYLPALIAIAATSMLTTRFGAKLATSMPTPKLKKIFAVFLLFVSFSMMF
ncbi:sulfite exporter TauE/SafE family protein [Vibrio hangzhouensis]|uniref:sulfite exporter TauE/SafE family protein n=1 Tax=Vibrio TaxID=662 RepID=UPI001C94F357|nr:sulfite exporter TauE/SafE family protein [Vibrio hangzhouensis]MBY6197157.1 sulfite exporter TauE/SafE family protein [Vibrio hangzhouensis]